MKRSLLAVAALAATFSVSAMAQSSQTPSAPSPASSNVTPTGVSKIAIIAFQAAVASTNEGRQALGQVQQKFAPKQAQLKAESDEIDSLKKQMQAAGSTLSADERATRLRTIDDKEKTLQRQAQDAQSEYQQSINEALQGIAQKFYTVLQDYSQAHGYGLVLDSSAQQTPIVWADAKKADITQMVINEYNLKSGVAAPAAQPGAPKTPTSTHHRTTTPH